MSRVVNIERFESAQQKFDPNHPKLQILEVEFPPSLNSMYRQYRGRTILSKRGREFKKCVFPPFNQYGDEDRLQVHLVLHPPRKFQFDCDNYAKPTLDLLESRGVFKNDNQIDFLTIRRGEVYPKRGRVVITIDVL